MAYRNHEVLFNSHISHCLWNICHICTVIIFLYMGNTCQHYWRTCLIWFISCKAVNSELSVYHLSFLHCLISIMGGGKKNCMQLLMHLLFMYPWNNSSFIWFGFHVCVWALDWGGVEAVDGLGITLSWAYLVLVLLVKFLSVLFSAF